MPGLSRQAAVAGGVPLPDMPRAGSLGHGAGLASLPGVRSADLGDGGDLVRGHAFALASVVRGALARDQPEERGYSSALGLQRVLGVGSYRTAWNLLHKLRRAMVRPGRDRLQGVVEVDEIFIGGPRPGKRGRGAQGKVLVVVAAQQAAKGIGRIRLTRVADASARSLEPAITATIEVGSQVRTDDWRGYSGLDRLGYRRQIPLQRRGGREPAAIGQSGGVAVEAMATRHAPGSGQRRAPRLLLGQYTFRFNRRTSGSRGLLFLRLIQQAVDLSPVPAKDILGGRRPAKINRLIELESSA